MQFNIWSNIMKSKQKHARNLQYFANKNEMQTKAHWVRFCLVNAHRGLSTHKKAKSLISTNVNKQWCRQTHKGHRLQSHRDIGFSKLSLNVLVSELPNGPTYQQPAHIPRAYYQKRAQRIHIVAHVIIHLPNFNKTQVPRLCHKQLGQKMIYCQLQQSSCFYLTQKSIKLIPVGDQLRIHSSKPFSCTILREENVRMNLWKVVCYFQ